MEGFEEISKFSNHRSWENDSKISKYQFVSWDSRCILLWDEEDIRHRHDFPWNQDGQIDSFVYIPTLCIFLAICRRCFSIFDNKLRLVSSIPHKDQLIISLAYDPTKRMLYATSARDVTMWTITKGRLPQDSEYLMTKVSYLIRYDESCRKIILECDFDKLYVILESEVIIYNISSQTELDRFQMFSDSFVTDMCWYPRSMAYLTAHSSGTVKYWSSHHNKSSFLSDGRSRSYSRKTDPLSRSMPPTGRFVVVQTYSVHKSPICSLIVHPSPGYVIAVGDDGVITVLNFDLSTVVLISNVGASISSVKLTDYGGSNILIICQKDGVIKLWKVFDFFKEMSSCLSPITSLHVFSTRSTTEEISLQTEQILPKGTTVLPHVERVVRRDGHPQSLPSEGILPPVEYMVAVADRDVQVMSTVEGVSRRLIVSDADDTVGSCALSVSKGILYCLMTSGRVEAYCIHNFDELPLVTWTQYALPSDVIAQCLTLLTHSIIKETAMSPTGEITTPQCNLRGEEADDESAQEQLVLGLSSGSLVGLDTLQNLAVVWVASGSLCDGPVVQLKYRRLHRHLLVLGQLCGTQSYRLRVLHYRSMLVIGMIDEIFAMTTWEVSLVHTPVAFGYHDGSLRLYDEICTGDVASEVLNLDTIQHMTTVLSLGFCDSKSIWASSSCDGDLKVWDFGMRCLATVPLTTPSTSLQFYGFECALVVAQANKLLRIPYSQWAQGMTNENEKVSSSGGTQQDNNTDNIAVPAPLPDTVKQVHYTPLSLTLDFKRVSRSRVESCLTGGCDSPEKQSVTLATSMLTSESPSSAKKYRRPKHLAQRKLIATSQDGDAAHLTAASLNGPATKDTIRRDTASAVSSNDSDFHCNHHTASRINDRLLKAAKYLSKTDM